MSNKRRKKHIPQRTCIGCREILSKHSMIRLVRTAEGVKIDSTGKIAGRGAYLHNKVSCWEKGLNGSIAHALRTELTKQEIEKLVEYKSTLLIEDQ